MKKANLATLLVILVVAAFLRLWKLGSIPPHLTPDEAALGYNAYSILKTGRDEYGEFLPIIFKSFGDYKPGLYVYLTVPFVATLGLNECAVRLPSALAGIIAVLLIYLIANELFKDKKFRIWPPTRPGGDLGFGIWPAFLLAINPWQIHFSRGAWEANVSLTLTLTGIYFSLRALHGLKFLILSSFFFSLTLLTYQGAKLATFVVLVILVVSFWPEIKRWLVSTRSSTRRILAGSVILGFIVSFPIILSMFQGKTGRLEVFSVFSYPRPQEYIQAFLDQGRERIGSFSYYLFHSEGINFTRGTLGRWFNHFSGRFLFFEGDWQNPRHSAPNQGMLLLADLVLLIFGFAALARIKSDRKVLFFILWLILAPLPAALSRDQVQAVRAFNMVVPLTIISSFGLLGILNLIERLTQKPLLLTTYYLLLMLLVAGSFIYFLDAYFIHLPVHSAQYWFYGYKQIVEEVTPIQSSYERIFFKQSYNQPYIYFLFYQKYDPGKYQRGAKLTESLYKDVGLKESLDNITFSNFSWPIGGVEKGDLVISDEVSAPGELIGGGFKVLSEVKYPDGLKTAFRLIEVE